MKKTREFWQGHVDAVKREGMWTSAYAKQHGVSLKSLYRWQRMLKAVPALPTKVNPQPENELHRRSCRSDQ